MKSLCVIDPGLLATVQDAGRPGYRKFGVPVSGAMDPNAHRLANFLVGNPDDAPVLEFTLKGGVLSFSSDAVLAVTGAPMPLEVGGKSVDMNLSFEVGEGDTLKMGVASRGCRSYLAVRGRLDVPKILGSYSGCISWKVGTEINAGTTIFWQDTGGGFSPVEAPKERIPYYGSRVTLSLMEGPEWDWISEQDRKLLTETEFEVGSDSNRMGIRLNGTSLSSTKKQMMSSAVIPGIVQLPPGGKPIILMNDCQTIGGYPRIAKIPDSELWRVGQLRPGNRVRFRRMG